MDALARIIGYVSLAGALVGAALFGVATPGEPPAEPVSEAQEPAPSAPLLAFAEITGGCGADYAGACVLAHAKPSGGAPVEARLRAGMVLRVEETLETEEGIWYKIGFDSWIRYPGRISGEWYVAATSSVRIAEAIGEESLAGESAASSTKRIVVDRSEQKLSAYDGDALFMEAPVSTGLALTPTPRGTFSVYKKTPARYMQGPLPGISDQYYDLPGVPWNLYFTPEGGVVHGAYWHANFGKPWSHGCVNLRPEDARQLYEWAEVGTSVLIRD